ncbi:uncharacterized protein LOC122262350 [Penaeus japonicus]|uniref:uncharacterized protein LOC122262350 n=1 Tax=Penaeus japonicus TaxID=27405 RepID=UPI001C70DDFF|nr:uncharacterized protein LOC122262350 [Penaeus japonicus]
MRYFQRGSALSGSGMTRLLAPAVGFLALGVVSSFEIQDGCRVRNSIQEDAFLFDTLDFSAIFPRNQTELKVLVKCDERSDLIHITSSNITHVKTHNGKHSRNTVPHEHSLTGWIRFTLSLKDELTLKDEHNHSWAPFDIPLSCSRPQQVSIEGKYLTRQCSPQTPMWVVDDTGVDIPLSQESGQVRETLTLFSVQPFSPSFAICDSHFQLGLRDHKLVIGTAPLEGSAYSLSLSVPSDNTLTVESEGEVVTSNTLKATPTSVRIRGRGGDRFVVVQHLLPRQDAEESEDTGPPLLGVTGQGTEADCPKPGVLVWTLAGVLATVMLAFVVLLIIHCLSIRTNKLGQPHHARSASNTAQPEATPVPVTGPPIPSTSPSLYFAGYERPSDNHLFREAPAVPTHLMSHSEVSLPGPSSCLPPPSPADFRTCAQRVQRDADEQDVYFEMDLSVSTAPPPKSYALAEIQYECEETINDTYQSAS